MIDFPSFSFLCCVSQYEPFIYWNIFSDFFLNWHTFLVQLQKFARNIMCCSWSNQFHSKLFNVFLYTYVTLCCITGNSLVDSWNFIIYLPFTFFCRKFVSDFVFTETFSFYLMVVFKKNFIVWANIINLEILLKTCIPRKN